MLTHMPRPIRPLSITPEQRAALRAVTNRPTASQRAHRRAWIILHRAEGLSQAETALKVGVSRAVAIKWERRFRQSGLDGLADAAGRGRKPSIDPRVRERIILGATRPPPNRTRWSVRSMAEATGVSKGDGAAVVERQRHQAACDADVQTVQRQALREEVPGT